MPGGTQSSPGLDQPITMSKRSKLRGKPWQQDLLALPVLAVGICLHLGSNTAAPALLSDARVESGPSAPPSSLIATVFGLGSPIR